MTVERVSKSSLGTPASCAARVPQAGALTWRELGCDCGNADNQRDARDTRTVRGELLLTNRRDVLADASLVPRDRTTSGVVSLVIRIREGACTDVATD